MTTLVPPPKIAPQPNSPQALAEVERRKKRVIDILSKGLPTLPQYVLDLNALLSAPSVDLKKVGKVVRTDPSLTAQVLRLCNSALFGLRRRVVSIEQAIVLVGTQRMRTLVLTCSLMQFGGKQLPAEKLMELWQHCFLCALLAERVATKIDYFEKEQAYLGGLLHDIGLLPLWIMVCEEESQRRVLPPPHWADNLPLERDYFGIDHCKAGRSMAVAWNFMPSFIDVFEYHHAPDRAQHDPYLVGIIAVADRFLQSHAEQEVLASSDATEVSEIILANDAQDSSFFHTCLPNTTDVERTAIFEMLQTEYIHLLPLVQIGLAAITGATPPKST